MVARHDRRTTRSTSGPARRIVLAGCFVDQLRPALAGDVVQYAFSNENVRFEDVDIPSADFLIVFGFGYIVPDWVLSATRVINLHGSLLPWGKGPHPHIWGWIGREPMGVTIHEMTVEVDGGPIIAQSRLTLDPDRYSIDTTLAELVGQLAGLFKSEWVRIRSGRYGAIPQHGSGSRHSLRQTRAIQHLVDCYRTASVTQFLAALHSDSGGRAEIKREP